MLTERDIEIVCAVAHYYVLNRPQIQSLCFPGDTSGRATRRRLQELVIAGYINRHRLVVHHPQAGAPGPVYYPARKGCELLAEHFEDERYLLTPTAPPQLHQVFHWLAVSETHIAIDRAMALQTEVAIAGWLNEWDIANKEESAPDKRFRLYTLLRESPRLVCAPDAAFMLALRGHKKVFYLEQDRNTSGVNRIAASKTPGYTELAARLWHQRHFPDATVESFTVLIVTTTARRREALRKALCGKPGADLWKFVAQPELTPKTFLHEPIHYPCDGAPVALVKPID